MPQFGGRSISAMKTLHPLLCRVFNLAIETTDFMIIQTSRTQEEQEADFKKGVSNAHWLESSHDFEPSFGADCAPIPLVWSNISAFTVMATQIKSAALKLNIPIVWGGDYHIVPGRRLNKDYPHFELANWRELAKQLPQQERLPLVS